MWNIYDKYTAIIWLHKDMDKVKIGMEWDKEIWICLYCLLQNYLLENELQLNGSKHRESLNYELLTAFYQNMKILRWRITKEPQERKSSSTDIRNSNKKQQKVISNCKDLKNRLLGSYLLCTVNKIKERA